MKLAVALLVLSTLEIPPWAVAQTEPNQIPSTGSPAGSLPQGQIPSSASQTTPIVDRPVSWKLLFPNLINDQERIWTFPGRLVQGQNWIPTTAVVGTTVGLIALDPTAAAYFRGTSTFHGFNNVISGNATSVGIVAFPISLYAVGWLRKDSKMQRTALFAGEAVADAEILTTVLKAATRRLRPSDIPAGKDFSDTWFKSSRSHLLGNGSFPSGHTIAAFSVATIIVRRYRNHRWVP
jgi:hypothetical protein